MMFSHRLAQFLCPGKISYSQCGEDLIANFVLRQLGVGKPTYLDIGAYDPVEYSNTYFFYLRGSRGVCIEPDPIQYEKIRSMRRNDVCLNVGIDKKASTSLNFYIMSTKTLSTFSKQEVDRLLKKTSYRVDKVVKIPVLTINQVLKKYFPKPPDLISIDAEGVDEVIVKSIDFKKYRPKVFCIETITFSETSSAKKVTTIGAILRKHGYTEYANTHINTIFIDKNLWKLNE